MEEQIMRKRQDYYLAGTPDGANGATDIPDWGPSECAHRQTRQHQPLWQVEMVVVGCAGWRAIVQGVGNYRCLVDGQITICPFFIVANISVKIQW